MLPDVCKFQASSYPLFDRSLRGEGKSSKAKYILVSPINKLFNSKVCVLKASSTLNRLQFSQQSSQFPYVEIDTYP
jgi:hypothetical protein